MDERINNDSEEEKEKKRKRVIILITLLLLLLVIVFMVSYSIFSYTKKGDTDNTITTGKIKFLYTENTGVGNGINISDAFPVSDTVGKSYSTENYVFDFKVTASVPNNVELPYEVTARMASASTLPSNLVKIYLVERQGNTEIEAPLTVNNGVVKKYSELNNTSLEVGTNPDGSAVTEKTIYTSKASGKNYEKDFRLRMWISEDANLGGVTNPDGSITYPYQEKTFTTTVNVYSISNQ